MTVAQVPESLRSPALAPIWRAARQRLDRFGPDRRGRLQLDAVPSAARPILETLLDRRIAGSIDLGHLESRLVRLDVGSDLDSALEALGFPASDEAEELRRRRRTSRAARAALRAAVVDWPEPWAEVWADREVGAGSTADLSEAAARQLAVDVRRVLDAVGGGLDGTALRLTLDADGLASRTDLAARLFGSAHALDSGSRRERAVARALALAEPPGPGRPDDVEAEAVEDGRAGERDVVWERAGVHGDLVSAPVLTWGLQLDPSSPLAALAERSTSAGLPLPITAMALRAHPVRATAGTTVLVAENPRVVEAAAESQVPFGVVTTNGNPRQNVIALVTQLLAGGATLRYHGDFDRAGLAICTRMLARGCRPYRMGATDYLEACDRAGRDQIELPVDATPCGATPWDPDLERAFNQRRAIVHEEFMLEQVLGL